MFGFQLFNQGKNSRKLQVFFRIRPTNLLNDRRTVSKKRLPGFSFRQNSRIAEGAGKRAKQRTKKRKKRAKPERENENRKKKKGKKKTCERRNKNSLVFRISAMPKKLIKVAADKTRRTTLAVDGERSAKEQRKERKKERLKGTSFLFASKRRTQTRATERKSSLVNRPGGPVS